MIGTRRKVFAVAGLLFSLPTLAFAQLEETAERRAACMLDAIMLCSSAIPNKTRIASCLASKMSQLSAQCRAQFATNPGANAAPAHDLKGPVRRQLPSAVARSH